MFDWLSSVNSEETGDFNIEEKEEEFNNVVRENIIALLTFILLFLIAYSIIVYYHRKKERDGWYGGEDEAKVYRISLLLCSVSLAVAISAILMLPMSMIGNEIVHLFPDSYWVQWLNGALIHNLWNYTYILSNLSIFVLLPFSYFFTESEGFSGQRKGLLPRVYETLTVLLLLAVLVFGLAVLALAFFDRDNSGLEILTMVADHYLQYLYSFLLCVVVAIMLTFCAPIGFIQLFDAVGKLMVKPNMFEKSDDNITATRLEEETLKRRLHSYGLTFRSSRQDRENLKQQVDDIQRKRKELERRKNASAWERNLGYPLVMILLIVLTGLALCLVSLHILQIVFVGDEELHPRARKSEFHKDYRSFVYAQEKEETKHLTETWWTIFSKNGHMSALGATSLSAFGFVGTLLEVAVIFYLMLASLLGFYNLPGFKRMRPMRQDTSMTRIIFNCVSIQLLGSSLPVLCRVLGITEFDLQGNYGQFSWLGNFYIVLLCNLVFAIITALCLARKVTIKIRTELYKALGLDKTKTRWPSSDTSRDIAGTSHSPSLSPNPSSRQLEPKHINRVIPSTNESKTSDMAMGNLSEISGEIDKLATKLMDDTQANFIREHLHMEITKNNSGVAER